MFQCIARMENSNQWTHVSLNFLPFAGERGIMELMMEKMAEKHPEAEFKLIPA